MKRTQIYILPEQYQFLEKIASITSRKAHKRISISHVIRSSINLLKEQYIQNKNEEKELLLMRMYPSPSLKELWDNEKDAEYDRL